jgi:DNA-binding NtrC family response regulator
VSPDGRDRPSACQILCEAGFRTLVAETGEVALELCGRAPRLPLVVVDLESDEVDWLTFTLGLHTRANAEVLAIAPRGATREALHLLRHRGSDFVLRPLDAEELLCRVRLLLERRQDRERGDHPHSAARAAWLESRNEAMRQVLAVLEKVAPTEATVLLRGETGTGKEVLARAIHAWSRRHRGPFFSLNCGSLHESLLDSELFGHERGAFTGAARRKRGLVELADGGTLFLDEIGELSGTMQVKLLRVLQEHEFMRVGGEEVLRCNVRVVAATHRDLEAMMERGQFRADLYWRLDVVSVAIPPLRERPEDLPDLAGFLLRRLAREHHRPVPTLAPDAVAQMMRHRWPGNVRELENVLERALLMADGNEIREVPLRGAATNAVAVVDAPLCERQRNVERDYLVHLLVRHRGSITAASAASGIPRRTLYRHLHALQIDPRRFR